MQQIKQTIALVTLAICAYTDIRERNIYIVPLVISAFGGILITLTAFFGLETYTKKELFADLVGPVIAAMIMVAATKFFDRYMGSGDGYLMATLGMLIGNRCNLYAVFAGSVFAALYALVMTIRNKRRFAACIPFAPFLMAGYVLVVANEI